MYAFIRSFIRPEPASLFFPTHPRDARDEASAVLETAVVITVLLAIAILFHGQISSFASTLFSKAFNASSLPSY